MKPVSCMNNILIKQPKYSKKIILFKKEIKFNI